TLAAEAAGSHAVVLVQQLHPLLLRHRLRVVAGRGVPDREDGQLLAVGQLLDAEVPLAPPAGTEVTRWASFFEPLESKVAGEAVRRPGVSGGTVTGGRNKFTRNGFIPRAMSS